ncbi:MAG: dihydrofolate reductase family protein [Cyclobacteriaceae bacterium]
MRKIVAGFAMSLDGYIEGPNGEYDWIVMDKDFDFAKHMERFDAFFFGRKSWDKLLPLDSGPFPGIKNYVFSNTLAPNKGFTLIRGDIISQVLYIKNQEGKDIAVYGGANLLSSLLNLNLVNELTMSIIPVILGQGKPMVDILEKRIDLALIKTKQFANGTVQLSYYISGC